MAWRRPGDKPLSEPLMACFVDAYMRHSASMSYAILAQAKPQAHENFSSTLLNINFIHGHIHVLLHKNIDFSTPVPLKNDDLHKMHSMNKGPINALNTLW